MLISIQELRKCSDITTLTMQWIERGKLQGIMVGELYPSILHSEKNEIEHIVSDILYDIQDVEIRKEKRSLISKAFGLK